MKSFRNGWGAASWAASAALVAALGGAHAQPTQLKTLAQARGIDMGLALSSSSGGAAVDTVVTRNFTGFVPENATKWGNISTAPGVYSWTGTDGMLDFAQKYGMKMRFHTFVWHQQSSYIANGHNAGVADPADPNKYTREEAFTHMRNHIGAVMSHIKGRGQMNLISEWDVVNEATARDSGNDDPGGLYAGMRRSTGNSINLDSGLSRWVGYTKGETNDFDYIDSAFAIAHRNDTNARLVYNDYDAESMGKKSNAVYNLVAKLKSRKIPVHVVGMQCHWYIGASNSGSSGAWEPTQIAQNMNRLAALGLNISLTELDIRFATQPAGDSTMLYKQKEAYETIMSICLSQPACKRVFVWGLRDGQSWVNSRFPGYGSPLLFSGTGSNYTPKPAYYGLISVLSSTAIRTPGARQRAIHFTTAGASYDMRGRQLKSLPAGPSFTAQKPAPAKTAR